jgi:hypothetical protein
MVNYRQHKGMIQRYTRPPKNSLEPEHSSTLPNSHLELIYYIESLAIILLVLSLDLNERWPPEGGRGILI